MAKKKKKRQRKTVKRRFNLKLKKHTVYSISQIVFFSLAGLVIVSFSRQGLILVKLNDLLVDYFAWTTIFLPFIFLSFGFLVSKAKLPLSQPNVLVGGLLFFVSILSMTHAGIIGGAAWNGMATLVTGWGAFIILFGTAFVGLVILFNTSVDRVFVLIANFFKFGKRYLFGDKGMRGTLVRSNIKVSGGADSLPKGDPIVNQKTQAPQKLEKNEPLAPKLVSNVPGEERAWKYPPSSIFSNTDTGKADRGDIKGNAATIEKTLESFGITARVVEVNLGPTVTQYALEVALGTRLTKVTALDRDLALALAAPTGAIRIEAPIPGRSLVGIELPNRQAEFVPVGKMLRSSQMRENKSKLSFALGLDVSGNPIVADLAKMPHVLIAGQTGSGKSVAINTILASLLSRAAPSEVKIILVDPKRVELTGYNSIPHLLSPVIVEPDKVLSALRWLLAEMDRRYKRFSQAGARNIYAYNEMSGFQALPYIVMIVDELADIMLYNMTEVEDSITRLAQMARATGIHMVLSTQRPSVNVITGLIKANIPTRIAFAVASQIDSRVILDSAGAEKLLGRGDMLYLTSDKPRPVRIQGSFVSDEEIRNLVEFLKKQGVTPQYTEEVTTTDKPGTVRIAGVDGNLDDLFKDAVAVVVQYERASASLLQRKLSIGYARAARIVDQLEDAGVIGPKDGSKPREVLINSAEEFLTPASSQAE